MKYYLTMRSILLYDRFRKALLVKMDRGIFCVGNQDGGCVFSRHFVCWYWSLRKMREIPLSLVPPTSVGLEMAAKSDRILAHRS